MPTTDARDAPPPRRREPRARRKTVLIVEDNDLNMKLFNDLLVAHGYATLQTRNGWKRSTSPASSGPTSS